MEDLSDDEFSQRWAASGLLSTPLYYQDALSRWPERHAAAIAAVAHARPGGVVVACGRGCDRTGLIVMLLLALAGVAPDDIAFDWELSVVRLRPRQPSYEAALEALLTGEGTSARDVLLATLESLDVDAYLRGGGLVDDDLAAVRARLVGTELRPA